MSGTASDGPFSLSPLPYGEDDLAPVISGRTLGFHYGKHHRGYVTKTNDGVRGTELESCSLEDVVRAAAKSGNNGLFNSAAQAWNHAFYWNSLTPRGGTATGGDLKARIDSDLGGVDACVAAFSKVAAGQFGSGWAWIVADAEGRLAVQGTANADTPLVHGATPLLTLDVWEHAYYLDYQNRRPDYIKAVVEKLLNWNFAAENLARAGK